MGTFTYAIKIDDNLSENDIQKVLQHLTDHWKFLEPELEKYNFFKDKDYSLNIIYDDDTFKTILSFNAIITILTLEKIKRLQWDRIVFAKFFYDKKVKISGYRCDYFLNPDVIDKITIDGKEISLYNDYSRFAQGRKEKQCRKIVEEMQTLDFIIDDQETISSSLSIEYTEKKYLVIYYPISGKLMIKQDGRKERELISYSLTDIYSITDEIFTIQRNL